ncbi:tryptophan dimethylallyltransferase family protein [Actinokineospora inagensis]|uniref:tryptophan dimethylallyltransferase family protein n=1 Tax=Actinokineospora inagensis TaxID=103730 RepID=UPI00040BAF34|nr:tryptophan dimethylallyltransferase family protein [Actinokineospora inagensis]
MTQCTDFAVSYTRVGCGKLGRALTALAFDPAKRATMVEELRTLLSPWDGGPVTDPTRHWSYASSDGAPLELSVAWSRRGIEVRVYFEPLGNPPTPEACRDAGAAATRDLARYGDVALADYLAVEDLFLVPRPRPPFSVLDAVMWGQDGKPWFKAYLNPLAQGAERAGDVLTEAMGRLGMGPAWTVAADRYAEDHADQAPTLFALDLMRGARTKVYFPHHGVDAARIERFASCARDHEPGSAAWLCQEIAGTDQPGKPPITSLVFHRGDPVPVSTVSYVPLCPNVDNDGIAAARVADLMRAVDLNPEPYLATLDALAVGPLATSRVQTYVGYRGGADPRVSVYFATGAFGPVTDLPAAEGKTA